MPTTEELARETIDALLTAAGWAVQDYRAYKPSVATGIALREVPLMESRFDYLLMLDRAAVGITEAKKERVFALWYIRMKRQVFYSLPMRLTL